MSMRDLIAILNEAPLPASLPEPALPAPVVPHTPAAGPIEAPIVPDRLSDILGGALEKAGINLHPHFVPVRSLPGYMRNSIAAMGRLIFTPFTSTPIEEIEVLSTMTSDETEVKATFAWIRHHGKKMDEATIRFTEILPGYAAEVAFFELAGFEFLCVADHVVGEQKYIYAWKASADKAVALTTV